MISKYQITHSLTNYTQYKRTSSHISKVTINFLFTLTTNIVLILKFETGNIFYFASIDRFLSFKSRTHCWLNIAAHTFPRAEQNLCLKHTYTSFAFFLIRVKLVCRGQLWANTTLIQHKKYNIQYIHPNLYGKSLFFFCYIKSFS